VLYGERATDVTVAELQQRYASSRELPGDRALATTELRRIVEHRYRHDYALNPDRPVAEPGNVA
jgi:hypothetical protein